MGLGFLKPVSPPKLTLCLTKPSVSEFVLYPYRGECVQNLHRITEHLMLEGTSWSHLVQPLSSSRVTISNLPRTMSRWVLSISVDGNSTILWAILLHCCHLALANISLLHLTVLSLSLHHIVMRCHWFTSTGSLSPTLFPFQSKFLTSIWNCKFSPSSAAGSYWHLGSC